MKTIYKIIKNILQICRFLPLKVPLSSPKVLLLTFKSVTFASWKLNFGVAKVPLSPDDSPTFAGKRAYFRVIMQKPCTNVSRIKIFVSAKITTLPEPLTFFGYEFSIRIYSSPTLPVRKNLFYVFQMSAAQQSAISGACIQKREPGSTNWLSGSQGLNTSVKWNLWQI